MKAVDEAKEEVVVELTEAGINEIIELANGGNNARKKVEKINKDIGKGKVSSKRVDVKLEKSSSVDSETGEEKNGSRVTLKVTAEKDNENVEIVHFIPKEMANTVDEIKFDVPPTEILEIDPVIRWEFVLETAGAVKEFSYFVEKEASIEQITTLAVAGDVKEPSIIGVYASSAWSYALPYVKGYWKYAAIIVGAIVVIIVLISAFSFKKMKTKVKEEEKPRGSVFKRVFHHKKKSLKEIGDELDNIGDQIKKI